jgi:hypothetical protein
VGWGGVEWVVNKTTGRVIELNRSSIVVIVTIMVSVGNRALQFVSVMGRC